MPRNNLPKAFAGKISSNHSQKTRKNHLGGEKRPRTTRNSLPNPFEAADKVVPKIQSGKTSKKKASK
jgi:hypothetical protein